MTRPRVAAGNRGSSLSVPPFLAPCVCVPVSCLAASEAITQPHDRVRIPMVLTQEIAVLPRSSAKPAVNRQCWPSDWVYSGFRYDTPAVLPYHRFKRESTIGIERIAGARH